MTLDSSSFLSSVYTTCILYLILFLDDSQELTKFSFRYYAFALLISSDVIKQRVYIVE